MGSIAVDEINALPGNLDAVLHSNEAVQAGASENSLRLTAILQQLKFGAHRGGAAISCDVLHCDIGDDPAGPRARLLRVDSGTGQPANAGLQQAPVGIDQGYGVPGALLVGLAGDPVPGIRCEQTEPFIETPFVEQSRSEDEKLLALEQPQSCTGLVAAMR